MVDDEDKTAPRRRPFIDLFVRYGSGANYLKLLTDHPAWNWIAWMLIIIAALAVISHKGV